MGCAGLATGLILSGTVAAQSSVWDRSPTRTEQPAAIRNHVDSYPSQPQPAHYRAYELQPTVVWDEFRSAWTPVDREGRTARSVEVRPPVSVRPSEPTVTYQPRRESQSIPRPMTLSESIVRQGLAAGLAPPNAAAVLRGQPVAPPPTAAAGFARLVLAGTPQLDARTTDPLPFPESATRQVSHAEERVFRLFETASRPTAPLFGDSAASNSIWDRAQAATDSYYRTGGEDVLLAPPALDVSATDSPSPGAGTVYLDGLDAVASPETAPRYRPSPLSQIRPERNYSPDKSPVCPDPAVAHCPHVELLPESSETVERSFAHMDFMWMPSNIFYSPLYFEDPALERYGHSHGPILQPLASASRFGVQLIGLPYQMALDPPHRRVYPLGFFRPGECAPKQVPNVPLNAEAAAKAGAVYTGLIFAFP